jgi:site-specific DNA-methyltransferase (adenine-specific)
MVLVDLPYGTTACAWDCVIPFDTMWSLIHAVVKPSAALVFTAQQPFTSMLASSNIKELRYEWIWEKPQGTNPLNAKVMPLKAHENVLVFYQERPTYNPQTWYSTPYQGFKTRNKKTVGEVYGASAHSVHRDNPEGARYPKSVLRFARETGFHPTQKPVALMEYLIKTYTNPNDTVLDFTMGSGTTGVACAKLNRQFIGIELESKYFDIAHTRMGDVYNNAAFDVATQEINLNPNIHDILSPQGAS